MTDKYLDSKDLELSKLLINSNIRKIPDYSKGFYSDFLGVSYDLKNYLDKLHALMQLDDDFELSDVLTSIERLENVVYSDVNVKNDDLAKFYIATSVAKKSLEYWTNNIDEWDYILNRNKYSKNDSVALKSTKTPGRRIGEIAVADVGGAVYAWAANVFPGIGQVTYAGAIVGGAVTSSVAAAVYHISVSIFRWD